MLAWARARPRAWVAISSAMIALTMPSERAQRRIERLLDQAEDAAETRDWRGVLESVAIREEGFYILTHPDAIRERVHSRAGDILLDRLPTYSPSIRSH